LTIVPRFGHLRNKKQNGDDERFVPFWKLMRLFDFQNLNENKKRAN